LSENKSTFAILKSKTKGEYVEMLLLVGSSNILLQRLLTKTRLKSLVVSPDHFVIPSHELIFQLIGRQNIRKRRGHFVFVGRRHNSKKNDIAAILRDCAKGKEWMGDCWQCCLWHRTHLS
jgi:hypothetical protein